MHCLRFLFLFAVIQATLCSSQAVRAQETPVVERYSDLNLADTSSSRPISPNVVSHRPGNPAKPLIERPGDRNVSNNPARRYFMTDSVRSGCPESVRSWASPTLSSNYSAGYAGGSTRVNSPHSRPRDRQEGTWGLDFSLWGQPKMAWLRWGDGSLPQPNGNFETDR